MTNPFAGGRGKFWIKVGATVGGAIGLFAGFEYAWGALLH